MAKKKYVSDNTRLMEEWDFTKNDTLSLNPNMLSINSDVRAWWICNKCGHVFFVTIRSRKKSDGCKKCSLISRSKKWLEQRGSFADKHPELIEEWHPLKNGDLTPNQILVDSPQKVWWICSKGHEWQATPNNRNHGKGCPTCANQFVWGGYNDLESQNPSLARQWHPYLNGDTKPSDVIVTSNKKAWWICENGHEWEAVISDRSRIGLGCPYCSNQKLLKGHNDLASVNPDLARQWHPTKNSPLTPDMVQAGSNGKVWWMCEKGHEWHARIAHRNKGVGCPHCAKELNTSFPEQAIYYYFSKITNAENRYRLNGNYEIDIYLPQYKVGIEYDGVYYHSKERAKTLEQKKEEVLHDAGITLIRVKETENLNDCIDTDFVFHYLYSSNAKHLGPVIHRLLSKISEITGEKFLISVDIERDRSEIYELYIEREKQNSLLTLRPTLAAEWHHSKNGRLKPDMVSLYSNKVVWWQCKQGHEWQAPINRRSGGIGCPICSNKKVLSGFNDLQTRCPDVAAQWHPTKNEGKSPMDVLPFSNKKAWWICEKGHEWQATINSRSSGNGCPYCKGVLGGQKRVANMIDQQGSLATRMPLLAAEWHPTKNEVLPTEVTISSGKKVWWRCNVCGHEWQAVIGSRSKGAGCPKCGKKQQAITLNANLLAQTGSLLENNPVVAAEWHPTKNGDLSASQVLPNSSIKVWWLCKKGHEWEAVVSNRNQGTGCPQCKAAEGVQKRVDKLIQKQGSLASALPVLAAEWHPTQNGDLNPSEVTISSGRKVWWKCSICGHEWAAVIGSRSKGAGCPQCAREKRKK